MLNLKKVLAKLLTSASYTYIIATKEGSVWTSGSIIAHKRNNVVTIKFNAVAHSVPSSRTTIASLPEGFRPPTQLIVLSIARLSGSLAIANSFFVNPDGTIQIEGGGANIADYCNASYVVR